MRSRAAVTIPDARNMYPSPEAVGPAPAADPGVANMLALLRLPAFQAAGLGAGERPPHASDCTPFPVGPLMRREKKLRGAAPCNPGLADGKGCIGRCTQQPKGETP